MGALEAVADPPAPQPAGLTDHERETLADAARFASSMLAPRALGWHLERCFDRSLFTSAADSGLCGLLVPRVWGGRGVSFSALVAVLGELAAVDFAFAHSLAVHNLVAASIAASGSTDQRERYLAPMVRGERIGAHLLTEPEIGSDAGALAATASRRSASWCLTGVKTWVANGIAADVLVVYVQTGLDDGWRGVGSFIVEGDQPGVIRSAPYRMPGARALGVVDIELDDSDVSDVALLAPPGDGFATALADIDLQRVMVAAMSVGALRVGLADTMARVRHRRTLGSGLSALQAMLWRRLADIATDLVATCMLIDHAATQLDAGCSASVEAARAHALATRMAYDGLSVCVRAGSGDLLLRDRSAARQLAAVRVAHYVHGPAALQNELANRRLFR